MQKNRRFNAGKQFRRLPVYSFRVCRKIRELLPGKNATRPGGIMGATSPGKEHGTALVPEPAQCRNTGIPAARRNIRLPHDQGGSARTMNPGKMTGNTTPPGREHGTTPRTGTGTAQGYKDAQLPAEISGCRTTKAAARAPQAQAKNTVLPAEMPGCHTTSRQRVRRNLRQRTRYCHPCRNRHNAGIPGCPTCPPKSPVAARPRRKRVRHKPRQRTRYCPRTGTGTMQEYRDAHCPPKYPVAARPRRKRTYRTPDQVHREVQNTAIRVAGVKIFYSERPAVMLANTSRYAAGAGCRIILFRFRPLNKQLDWLPFPSILR